MRIQADLHVHTIASGHAFSTVAEIAREANLRGLRAVGIADHGPALPGGPHLMYFGALRFLPRFLNGVRLLRGVEANVINGKGHIDLPHDMLGSLDYAMVGFHEGCGFSAGNAAKNTKVLIAVMQQTQVRVITHPGNPAFPIEAAALAQAASDLGVALEMNNASFTKTRRGSLTNCAEIATQVARAGGLVCLSSDAHIASDVGRIEEAWKVAERSGIRPEQVVNRSYEALVGFLGISAEDRA